MGLSSRQQARLNTLYARRTALAETIKGAEDEKRDIDTELLRLTDDAGGELATDTFKAKVVAQTRSVLSEELLLKHGVKATVIAKSKVETTSKPYVKLTAVGEREGAVV